MNWLNKIKNRLLFFAQPKEANESMSETSLSDAMANPIVAASASSFSERKRILREIVARQFADAEDKLQNQSYWGPNGILVKIAAASCQRAIGLAVDDETQNIQFDRLLENLAYARKAYDLTYPDEDGYGAGTFGEVMCDILATKIKTNYDLVSLNELKFRRYDTLSCYLILPLELGEFADELAHQNYQRCYAIAETLRLGSRVEKNRRFARRLTIMILIRIEDFDAAEKLLSLETESSQDEREDIYDRLAVGEMALEELSPEMPPIYRAEATFWAGAYQKSVGDKAYRKTLQECVDYDFDDNPCVLATIDLGLKWKSVEKSIKAA